MPRNPRTSAIQALAALALLALTAPRTSAGPVVASSAAGAAVVDHASGYVDGSINFGGFVPGPAGGTVTIDPRRTGAARLSYSGVTMVVTNTISDAWFYVSGTAGAYYRITLPASTQVTNDDGVAMLVDTYRCCPTSMANGSNRVYNTLGRLRRWPSGGYPAGTDEFNVGATCHVAAHQPIGAYSGIFTLSVGYE